MKTNEKEFVTQHELDIWGGEIMRQLDEIRANILTKDEAREIFLTKDQVREIFLNKEEFERVWLILDEIRENTKRSK